VRRRLAAEHELAPTDGAAQNISAVIRDYGMRDRREAPQYYVAVE
jgi:hypothetical protein